MGALLALVSIVLAGILFPAGMIITFIKNLYKRRWKYSFIRLDAQFLSIATSIDATGNVVCKDLFNWLLITESGYKFGNRKETISSVLGKNQNNGTLTKTGKWVVMLLNKAEADHGLKSIDEMV